MMAQLVTRMDVRAFMTSPQHGFLSETWFTMRIPALSTHLLCRTMELLRRHLRNLDTAGAL